MGYLTLKVTKRRNGTEYSRFVDTLGRRVGTSAAMLPGGGGSWVRADQLTQLAAYGIELQQEQLDAGLGSDGAPMKPLGGRGKAVFVARRNGKAVFERRGYADWKTAHGLQPVRDLYGAGTGGHMRDDIRIKYVDDRQAKIGITTSLSLTKAKANERRAPWWGWSPDSVSKMTAAAAGIFNIGLTEYLISVGLASANFLPQLAKQLNLRSGTFRRAA